MKKELKKKRKSDNFLQFYVSGGTNETCTNPSCGGSGGSTPGGGCKAMGGDKVCAP